MLRLFACLMICALPMMAAADLVSPYGGETAPSFAEIRVTDTEIVVALEIDLQDYPHFVAPDDGQGHSLAARTGARFEVSADGRPLPRRITAIDLRPRIDRQTAASNLYAPRPRSARVVFVEMRFPFEGQPDAFTFTPPLAETGLPLASLGLLVEHGDVPVTDYRYLSQAETLRPDWSDPWFTRFDNPNLTRHHKSPLMSFLAMEPREVRHEIIFRLTDLENWTGLELTDVPRLTPTDIASVKGTAADFFRSANPLRIDGTLVPPHSAVVQRLTVGAAGLQVLPDDAPGDPATMLFGVVLSWPRPTLPRSVEMTWELFPPNVDAVPVTLSDPAGGVPAQVYPFDPTVTWNNHLKTWSDPRTAPVPVQTSSVLTLPVLAAGFVLAALAAGATALRRNGKGKRLILCAAAACAVAAMFTWPLRQPLELPGTARLDEAGSQTVLQAMLDNVSAALLEPTEDTLNSALAPFVAGQNRDPVRTELQRGLTVALPSGARARTDEILDLQVETVSPGERPGSHQILANWTARMSGGHWGHLHTRSVAYRGLMDVSRRGDSWTLDGLTVLSARQKG